MEKPQLELAELFDKFDHLLDTILPDQYKVINAIKNCRTSALGGHVLTCNECNYHKNAYNSCRNRHCPKCQFLAKIKWIERRKEDLLPCQYFHVVFTVPGELRRIFLQNKEICYRALFKASSETLKEVAENPKNFGAEIGFIGILHTWSQNLIDHPHIHYVIPAGGLNKKKNKWVKGRANYFLNVKILSTVFRAKLLEAIRKLYEQEDLLLLGEIEQLTAPHIFEDLLGKLARKEWNVYAKKPFAGPEQVINYLGSYTHRIAISNYRLIAIEGEEVVFKVRDKDNPGKSKMMRLHAKEFLRRFLLHVLPKGFVRIRHYGILGNRLRKEKIKLIRELEKIIYTIATNESLSWQEIFKKVMGIDINICPRCKKGELLFMSPIAGVFNSS